MWTREFRRVGPRTVFFSPKSLRKTAENLGNGVPTPSSLMRWRIETKNFLNFADALTAGVIEVQRF